MNKNYRLKICDLKCNIKIRKNIWMKQLRMQISKKDNIGIDSENILDQI